MGKQKVKPNCRRRSLRPVHRLVLLRAPPRLQPHRGCPLPHALGTVWPPIPSTNNSRRCEDSRMKLPTLDCSALNWLLGSAG